MTINNKENAEYRRIKNDLVSLIHPQIASIKVQIVRII